MKTNKLIYLSINQLDAQNLCFRVSSFHASTPIGVMIPEAVQYNFDLLMMSTWCSKHVEALNELIVKQKFCASSWLILR